MKHTKSDSSMTKDKKKSYVVALNKTKKDVREIEKLIEGKREKDKLEHDLEKVNNQISSYKAEIKRLFTRSNAKETNLKNYIAKLNSIIEQRSVPVDPAIEMKHKEIETLIGDVQNMIKKEINHTKNEMEREIDKKFADAEKAQAELIKSKKEEQKKVLEKMNKTRVEIESIRYDFERINIQCDKLTKEHESLRVLSSSLEEDNLCLVEKINRLKEEYVNLKINHKAIFKKNPELVNSIEKVIGADLQTNDRLSDDENDDIYNRSGRLASRDFEDNNRSHVRATSQMNKPEKELDKSNTFESLTNKSDDEFFEGKEKREVKLENMKPDEIINVIKSEISAFEHENKELQRQNVRELQKKNEAQQLMQKCIEDLKFDLVKVTKEINLLRSESITTRHGSISLSELSSKLQFKADLEQKLKILTFVYDNAFQYDSFKKNTLFRTDFRKKIPPSYK